MTKTKFILVGRISRFSTCCFLQDVLMLYAGRLMVLVVGGWMVPGASGSVGAGQLRCNAMHCIECIAVYYYCIESLFQRICDVWLTRGERTQSVWNTLTSAPAG